MILTLVWIGLAGAAIAWAAFWPVNVRRAQTESPPEPEKGSVGRPTADMGKSEVWSMRWQSWQNKKMAPVAVAKPVKPAPAPPPAPVVETLPGISYMGAIFEDQYAFGFFSTPTGPKYAAVGEIVKFGPESMKVLKIESAASTVEFKGRSIRLVMQRRESRLGPASPAGSPPVPPPEMNKPDMMTPIILNRTNK